MSLTGSLLWWTIWLLAIALNVRIIVSWPRSAGPGALVLLRRIGYQFAVVVTVLLAVGITLNDEYGWYANWSDLASSFSNTPGGDVLAAGSAGSDAAGALPAGSVKIPGSGHHTVPLSRIATQTQLDLSRDPGPLGQYHNYVVPGPISGLTSSVTVWFPAAYTDPQFATHRFPVIEAFHGVPGSTRQVAVNMQIGKEVADRVSAGQLANSIVVMPAWTPHGVDTECVDGGAGQPQMEQWITRDVTDWVEHNLRVSSDRSSWATFGLSAGAWCGSMLAMLHPDLYAAGISLGGYFEPSFEEPYIPFQPGSLQFEHYDLLRLAHDSPPKVALWVQTSKADVISYVTAEQLLTTARPPLSVTADVLPNAGHRIQVWFALIPDTLRWLGATVPGFRPASPLKSGT